MIAIIRMELALFVQTAIKQTLLEVPRTYSACADVYLFITSQVDDEHFCKAGCRCLFNSYPVSTAPRAVVATEYSINEMPLHPMRRPSASVDAFNAILAIPIPIAVGPPSEMLIIR